MTVEEQYKIYERKLDEILDQQEKKPSVDYMINRFFQIMEKLEEMASLRGWQTEIKVEGTEVYIV